MDALAAANHFTNVVPMTVELNRQVIDPTGKRVNSEWRSVEARTVNEWAPKYGHVEVEITPIYDPNPPRLSDGTPIPSSIHKVILMPETPTTPGTPRLTRQQRVLFEKTFSN